MGSPTLCEPWIYWRGFYHLESFHPASLRVGMPFCWFLNVSVVWSSLPKSLSLFHNLNRKIENTYVSFDDDGPMFGPPHIPSLKFSRKACMDSMYTGIFFPFFSVLKISLLTCTSSNAWFFARLMILFIYIGGHLAQIYYKCVKIICIILSMKCNFGPQSVMIFNINKPVIILL